MVRRMIVTVKAPSRQSAARVQFECIKYGLECEYQEGNVLQITSASIDKPKRLSDMIGGDIVAVVNRTIFDPKGES